MTELFASSWLFQGFFNLTVHLAVCCSQISTRIILNKISGLMMRSITRERQLKFLDHVIRKGELEDLVSGRIQCGRT